MNSKVYLLFIYILVTTAVSAQSYRLLFAAVPVVKYKNNEVLHNSYVLVYPVKKQFAFKKGYLVLPDDSACFSKPLKVYNGRFIDGEFKMILDLSFNSEYIAEFHTIDKNYYPTQYYINTRMPKTPWERPETFNCRVDLQKKVPGEKEIFVKRICFFHPEKRYFVGINKVVLPVDTVSGSPKLNEKQKSDSALLQKSKNMLVKNRWNAMKARAYADQSGNSFELYDSDTVNKLNPLNQKEGKWIYLNDEQKPDFSGTYVSDAKEGEWLKFFVNDSIEVKAEFMNNMPTGNYSLFFENGKLRSEGKYDPYLHAFTGTFKKFDISGELIKYFNYNKKGEKSGKQLLFYSSGKLALSANMKNNSLHGRVLFYRENGDLACIAYYLNNQLVKEEVLDKRAVQKDMLLRELFVREDSVARDLDKFYRELSIQEKSFDKILSERTALLEKANLTISLQQRTLFLQKASLKKIQIQNLLKAQQIKEQRFYLLLILAGLFLVFIVSVFIWIFYRKSKIQNVALKEKNSIIEQKNREILDSIEYAKRIQTAILPPPRIVKEFLNNSFILYLPKDIVAGDFYWMESIDNTIYFAACDCTGHGVPGAMVSVVCNNALNRAVNEFGERLPGKIFDKTRELVLENFAKSDEEVNDGMDASLCALDVSTGKLYWCGANNPLWVYRAASKSLEEIKPDKQAIGRGYEGSLFTTHELQLQKGDTLYLFTDGYADQFGGEKGKKLTKARFREILVSMIELPMDVQRQKLLAQHDAWRGKLEQVDDICVMGVRV